MGMKVSLYFFINYDTCINRQMVIMIKIYGNANITKHIIEKGVCLLEDLEG